MKSFNNICKPDETVNIVITGNILDLCVQKWLSYYSKWEKKQITPYPLCPETISEIRFRKGLSLSKKSSTSPFCVNLPLNNIQLSFALAVKIGEINYC